MARLFLLITALLVSAGYYNRASHFTTSRKNIASLPVATIEKNNLSLRTKRKAEELRLYARRHRFSTDYCFLVDMSLPGGKNRFFIYDLNKDSVVNAGLVAHGSCHQSFLENVSFSNEPECGCSAEGKYRIGYAYTGMFGKAFKLYGLDKSNSNAFARNIVLHSYQCVPDEEIYPQPLCNSLGCPMVSPNFLQSAAKVIEHSSKPVLLYVFR